MNPLTDHPAELMHLWQQISQEMHERFRPIFQELMLPPMAPILIKQICEEPGITVSELARRTGIAKSHVSRVVDTMAAKRCLAKESDPQDQRLVRVFPTEHAVRHQKELDARLAASWVEVTADLTPAEIEAVISGLYILLTALRRTKAKQS